MDGNIASPFHNTSGSTTHKDQRHCTEFCAASRSQTPRILPVGEAASAQAQAVINQGKEGL